MTALAIWKVVQVLGLTGGHQSVADIIGRLWPHRLSSANAACAFNLNFFFFFLIRTHGFISAFSSDKKHVPFFPSDNLLQSTVVLLLYEPEKNSSSVSLSNFSYYSEKSSSYLCHLYDDTYQSSSTALKTHLAVYEIIMDLVTVGISSFSV